MARTINEMARARRAAVRVLRKELRNVETKVNKSIRRITRILERKNKVPEFEDLDELTVDFADIQREFDEYHKSIEASMREFQLL